eukprot:CAMPEP_0171121188 /NCGR_PEP_ID=MMETSP0766_2-20121228/101781_1 /TAXON_ID=439317 /ORGANISM="Gambierdiscus australes, Strain CAWD 149" /LENGTH=77 /DNA_ID=CAMNT_0011583957 /DNA_START=255 /DNA_END=485 /DNA_ORIENTATION=-
MAQVPSYLRARAVEPDANDANTEDHEAQRGDGGAEVGGEPIQARYHNSYAYGDETYHICGRQEQQSPKQRVKIYVAL